MNTKNLEQRLDQIISPVMHQGTPGMALLIAKDEDILIRKAYGMADLDAERPIRPEDNFVVASNTKQFTCVAVMMLAEQGLLELDEPIERFFSDFPPYKSGVTVRHLMTHVSGIKEYFAEGIWETIPQMRQANTRKMVELIKGFGDLDFQPETQFSYCNSAYVMLGQIVEQLSHRSFGRFLEEEICQPVGMNHTVVPDYMDNRPPSLMEGYTLQENGSFQKQTYDMALVGYADGNMQSNVDDLYQWHKYLYMGDSQLLLPRSRLNQAFCENRLKDGAGTGYGLGFFLGHYKGHREIWHTGGTNGFISRCSRFPDDGITLIMLTNYEGLPKDKMYEKIATELFGA